MKISKLTLRIAVPVILAGTFAASVFVALDYERLGLGFYIVFGLLIIYVFAFGFATGQSFASPVKMLLNKATDLSNGNLSSRVYLETKDELSELAKVFNQIAEKLEESRDLEQKTEQSVDIKVRARTRALEETINALEQKIKNRTIELQKMISNLEQFRNQSREREQEVLNLKQQIKKLKEDLAKDGKKPKIGQEV